MVSGDLKSALQVLSRVSTTELRNAIFAPDCPKLDVAANIFATYRNRRRSCRLADEADGAESSHAVATGTVSKRPPKRRVTKSILGSANNASNRNDPIDDGLQIHQYQAKKAVTSEPRASIHYVVPQLLTLEICQTFLDNFRAALAGLASTLASLIKTKRNRLVFLNASHDPSILKDRILIDLLSRWSLTIDYLENDAVYKPELKEHRLDWECKVKRSSQDRYPGLAITDFARSHFSDVKDQTLFTQGVARGLRDGEANRYASELGQQTLIYLLGLQAGMTMRWNASDFNKWMAIVNGDPELATQVAFANRSVLNGLMTFHFAFSFVESSAIESRESVLAFWHGRSRGSAQPLENVANKVVEQTAEDLIDETLQIQDQSNQNANYNAASDSLTDNARLPENSDHMELYAMFDSPTAIDLTTNEMWLATWNDGCSLAMTNS